jgi:plastocyanin
MKRWISAGCVSMLAGVALYGSAAVFEAEAATTTVASIDNSFDPQNITIAPGDTVEWTFPATNQAPHTVKSDGLFVSGNKNPGASAFSFTFQDAGTYTYYCEYHGTATSGMNPHVIAFAAAGQSDTHAGGDTDARRGDGDDGSGGDTDNPRDGADAVRSTPDRRAGDA